MSKWFQRCVAAVLLLTFHPGTPTIIPSGNNSVNGANVAHVSQKGVTFFKAAEASYGFNTISYSGISAAEDETFLGRLGIVGKVVLGIIGIVLLFTCWPIVVAVAVGWAVVSWLFFGPEKK